jgi:phosphatidylinositol alpha-1,6-mannosyltransferase
VSDVLPAIAQTHPNVLLVIVGDTPENSLYAQSQSPASIQAAAEAAGVGQSLCFLGKRFGPELADAYCGADLHVFPVRELSNDPEGFGMVAVEAAAHGLPTVAYATGGVVDAVEEGVSGRLVAAGNDAGFSAAVLDLLKNPMGGEPPRRFAARFAWKEFGAQLCQQLQNAP